MSRRKVIEEEPKSVCEFCGKYDELRPYGASGERICFECGMKNKAMTERRCRQHLFGEGFDA